MRKCYGVNQEAYVRFPWCSLLRHVVSFYERQMNGKKDCNISVSLERVCIRIVNTSIIYFIDLKLRKIKVDMDGNRTPTTSSTLGHIIQKRRAASATGIRTLCNNNNYIKCHIDL